MKRGQLPLSTKIRGLIPSHLHPCLIRPFLWGCFRKETVRVLGKERPDPDTLLTLLNMGPQAEDTDLLEEKGETSKLELPASAWSRSLVVAPAPKAGPAPRP